MLNGGFIGVENEKLKVNGSGVEWMSQRIDVSEVDSVLLSADVQGIGALDNGDDIKLVYRTEGNTSWTLWERPNGAFSTTDLYKIRSTYPVGYLYHWTSILYVLEL